MLKRVRQEKCIYYRHNAKNSGYEPGITDIYIKPGPNYYLLLFNYSIPGRNAPYRIHDSFFHINCKQAVAQINKFNNCHFEFLAVILNLFQNLLIAISYETLKQVQGDSLDVQGSNT